MSVKLKESTQWHFFFPVAPAIAMAVHGQKITVNIQGRIHTGFHRFTEIGQIFRITQKPQRGRRLGLRFIVLTREDLNV